MGHRKTAMNTALGDIPRLGSSQRRLQLDALERLANIDPLDLCSEAKVEKCRAIRDLRSCGRVVQHVLTPCGHASLCVECSQRCDLCPICRVQIIKHEGTMQLRLYNQCLEAGLISRKSDEEFKERKGDGLCWTEDIQHLYSLFDVALENNLISLVCHYVTDVCMDESAVSSDAIVAMLLDGGVVKDWCKRTLLNVISSLPEIYNLGVQSDVFSKFTTQLDALVNVLEVLEGSLLDLPSPQLLELQHLLETASKVKQHLEVMAWCARHSFLEGVPCRYMGISHWRNTFRKRKAAGFERAWPDYSNNTSLLGYQSQATLFIEDALANLNVGQDHDGELGKEANELSLLRQGGNLSRSPFKNGRDGPPYPPENLRAAVDLLFLDGSSGLILAKRAIFLYYLFDRHWNVPNTDWRNIVDDYAGTFGITRNLVLESLVFYLLDDNTEEALEEACHLLPEIVSPATHPKVARVLLERRHSDAALMVLRCSGHDGQFGIMDSVFHRAGVVALPEAVTAVRVRLECGLLTEAYLYQRNHCLRVRAEQSKHRQMTSGAHGADMSDCRDWLTEMEVLVGEICWLCIRRKLVDRMIELPWHSDEEKFLQKCLLERADQDQSSSAGNLLVVFFIQRCRYPHAYQIHKTLCDLEQRFISQSLDKKMVERIESASEWRASLIEKCIELLPEIERRQVRSGNIYEYSVSPLRGEQHQPLDMEKEQAIFSTVSNTSASMEPPAVAQQLFDGKASKPIQNSFINSDDIPSASTLGRGDNQQPCVLQVKPFRSIVGSPSLHTQLDSSPLLNGQAKQKDQEKPGVSPIRGRILNYDFESGKPLHENESAEQHSFLSNYTPSQVTVNVEKEVAYRIQSKGFLSDSSNETRGLEVFIGTQNGTGSSKQNGHSISGAVSRTKDGDQVGLENGYLHTRDLPTTSSFNAPRTSIVMPQERLSISTRTDLDISGLPISSPGSSGKRLPSDRSWLASPSDDDFWRGKGGGTVPSFSFGAKNQDVSPYSHTDSYQSQNSGVESPKPNGSVRWRSDEGEEEDDPRPKSSGRLKGSSVTKGKGIGRSRFCASRIP